MIRSLNAYQMKAKRSARSAMIQSGMHSLTRTNSYTRYLSSVHLWGRAQSNRRRINNSNKYSVCRMCNTHFCEFRFWACLLFAILFWHSQRHLATACASADTQHHKYSLNKIPNQIEHKQINQKQVDETRKMHSRTAFCFVFVVFCWFESVSLFFSSHCQRACEWVYCCDFVPFSPRFCFAFILTESIYTYIIWICMNGVVDGSQWLNQRKNCCCHSCCYGLVNGVGSCGMSAFYMFVLRAREINK